jgi:LPPG:FO 2-phospho-L-lactate transferase
MPVVDPRVTVLCGGVGAARLLAGAVEVVDPASIAAIVNTGDDTVIHGLAVSPDLDTVVYTLGGGIDPDRGWGLGDESWQAMDALERYASVRPAGSGAAATWFRLGDRDLATHLYRTDRLRAGARLSEVTRELCAALAVKAQIVPATDSRLRTIVRTPRGRLEFQEYFVRRRARDVVEALHFQGARQSRPVRGVLTAIARARAVILCPSNPFISIGPILAVPGMREALRETRAPVAAISPIVGGRALKGPAARMMKSMGHGASAAAVARLYRDFVNVFVLDHADAKLAPAVEAFGMRAIVTNTIMSGVAQRKALARAILRAVERG